MASIEELSQAFESVARGLSSIHADLATHQHLQNALGVLQSALFPDRADAAAQKAAANGK